MILTKELIAKGLVGTTLAVVPTTLGVVYRKEIGQFLSTSDPQQVEAPASGSDEVVTLLESAGLKCKFADNSCEITSLEIDKTINVKHDATKEEEKTFTISNSAKIKVQKNVDASENYNQGVKLTIEGGDITLTTTRVDSTTITKLEEFETYEIVSEDNKHYLSRKKTADEEKKRILGLPEEADCVLPTTDNVTKTCSGIDAEKLKKISFEGKAADRDVTIDGGTPSITLKITKTTDTTTYPHGGYKFVFETTQNNITIPKSGADNIVIKKGTNTEFKIKKEGTSLTLEKAWDNNAIIEKIGLSCDSNNNECTLQSGKNLNIKEENNKRSGVSSISPSGNGKIKLHKDTEEYNQGFKFSIEGGNITLSGEGDANSISQLDNGTSYQMEFDDNNWFLSKKNG